MKQRGEREIEGQSLSYLPALICGVGRKGFRQTNSRSSYAQFCRKMPGKVERRSEEGLINMKRREVIDLMKGIIDTSRTLEVLFSKSNFARD